MSSQIYEHTNIPIPKPRRLSKNPEIQSEETNQNISNVQIELKDLLFTNPAAEVDTVLGKSSIPGKCESKISSLDSKLNSDVNIAKNTPKYPDIFHHFILFLLELYSVRFLDLCIEQCFPKAKKWLVQIPKRMIQILHLIMFIIMSMEGVRVIVIENTKVISTDHGFEYGSIDMTSIILFLAYSVMSFFSLAFLYFNSDIIRQTGVKFRTLSVKPLKSCLSDCFLIFLYCGLFLLLAITIIWKLLFTFIFYRAFQDVDILISIFITLTVVVYYMVMWHLSPFMLCFSIRSICKQLQHEIEEEIEITKQIIMKKINSDKNIYIVFYDRLDRVYEIARKVRYIIALIILITITVSISISLSAFDKADGILTASRDNNINDKINKFDYLWLILASYYFLFTIIFMTQGISKLNSLLNRFSELVLESKEVREHLNQLVTVNPNELSKIRENLQLISSSKIRFTAAFFGDFTSGLFYTLMLPAMTFMVPFLLGLKYLFTHFNEVFFP